MIKKTDVNAENQIEAAEINVKLGMYYLSQEKNVVLAKQKFLKATKQAPDNPVVWYALAYFEENTRNLVLAEQYYRHAIKLSPENGAALNNYGAFLCRQGEYRKAIDYFLKAANDEAYLNVGKAYENAARCAMKIPDENLMKKYYEIASERDPTIKYHSATNIEVEHI